MMIMTATMLMLMARIIVMLTPPSSFSSLTVFVGGVTGSTTGGYGCGSGSGTTGSGFFTPPMGVQVGSIVIIPSFTIPLLCSMPCIPTHCLVGPNSYRLVTLACPGIS